jgi:enoyl-CoA hydratase/carnithine racemase
MAENQFVKFSKDEAVGILTIERPPVNALNREAIGELEAAFDKLVADSEIKVVILTGGGHLAFIAGADVQEIAQIRSPEEGEQLAEKGQQFINKVENCPKPVIAAINGICLGGGNELAMGCHIRVASDRAKFSQPEINLGIIPGFGGTQRLARLCGEAKAKELVLTGEMITAQEALRIGLVNRVVPDGEVLKQSIGLAKKIAAKGQAAVRLVLEAVREGCKVSLQQGLDLEAKLFGKVCKTEDMKEGLKAFLEKRQPRFQDR